MNVNEKRGKKASQFVELLLSRDDFKADVGRLRAAWHIPKDGLTTGKEHEDWYNMYNVHHDIDAQFKHDISKTFIKSNKYGLAATSWRPLLHYVMENKVPANFNGALPVITQTPDKHSGRPIYTMQFYEHTTESEVRNAFGKFKAQNLNDKRQQLIQAPLLEKMQLAQKFREDGMTWRQVASGVNEALGGSLEYNDARKLVERYKKRLGM